jgi:hypothetical protein
MKKTNITCSLSYVYSSPENDRKVKQILFGVGTRRSREGERGSRAKNMDEVLYTCV